MLARSARSSLLSNTCILLPTLRLPAGGKGTAQHWGRRTSLPVQGCACADLDVGFRRLFWDAELAATLRCYCLTAAEAGCWPTAPGPSPLLTARTVP